MNFVLNIIRFGKVGLLFIKINFFDLFPYYVHIRTNCSCGEPMGRIVDETGIIQNDVTDTIDFILLNSKPVLIQY